MKNTQKFDVIIVGGAMVGSALACALANSGLKIALLEKHQPTPYASDQAMDLRVSAISIASQQLLEQAGAWSTIMSMRSAPYRYLETWEGNNSNLIFDSQEMGRQHLGHIIENRLIQLAFWQQLLDLDNVEIIVGNSVTNMQSVMDGYQMTVGERELHCKLLVGADGANSSVREMANIGITAWDYEQHAMLININTAAAQQNKTWQQFHASGPRAFLPLSGHKASLVWYDSPKRIKQLANMSKEQLKRQIIECFPDRIGEFDVEASGSFPLTRRHAQQYFKPNLCLVGDAAHTINPLAGQGVNLGFKDVALLSQTIKQAIEEGQCWWHVDTLAKYQQQRRPDNLLMQGAMDLFYLTFSNNNVGLRLIRNGALKIAEKTNWGKNKVMKYAMGL